MKSPKTVDEYIDLVHQAVYEVDELRSIMGEDEEDFAPFRPYIDQLDADVRRLYDDMLGGRYQFDPNGPDLPFMDAVRKLGRKLPFSALLSLINQTHCHGLDTEV